MGRNVVAPLRSRDTYGIGTQAMAVNNGSELPLYYDRFFPGGLRRCEGDVRGYQLFHAAAILRPLNKRGCRSRSNRSEASGIVLRRRIHVPQSGPRLEFAERLSGRGHALLPESSPSTISRPPTNIGVRYGSRRSGPIAKSTSRGRSQIHRGPNGAIIITAFRIQSPARPRSTQ